MGGRSSSKPGSRRRRTRPAVEGLEGRVVMSHAGGAASAVAIADQTPLSGVFSDNFQTFQYTTPQGTHVKLQIVGRGSLEGTTVDSSGALHLLYGKSNAFTKIMSDVHGGTGQADLASVYNRDQFNHQGANAISGVGSTLIGTINLPNFNLIPGGTINATAGINILGLNSVGPNTQIQLRDIPPSVTAGTTTTTSIAGVQNRVVTGLFSVPWQKVQCS